VAVKNKVIEIYLSRSLSVAPMFLEIYLFSTAWLVRIYVRLHSKITVGESRYEGAKKYCTRCEVFFYHNGGFCPCCGMALRLSPTARKDKEKLRQLL
jgi:uncharacterized paraquat-inducible protein A